MSKIKNFVFDVGDVLIDFRYRDHMRDLGFSEEAVEYLSEHMILTEFWHEMDLGLRSEKDAIEHYSGKMPQYSKEVEIFWKNTEDLVREQEYSAPLIRAVKAAGYGAYILSNYPKELSETHWPKFRFLPEADGYIISALEKLAKPDPAIFRLLTTRFGLELSECIFIDDNPRNVEAAKKLGMEAIHFTGYDMLIRDLSEQYGIVIG